MAHQDNLIGVIATLFKYKKQILWATLATAVGTTVLSFAFMDNYYQATTIFYPVNSDVFKPEQLFGQSTKDMEYHGDEKEVDRILTIAKSDELYDFLIQKYDLYRHYKIDTTSEKAAFKVREALEKLYVINKTKNNAVELSVEDKDRRLAADMANAARQKVDEISQRMVREVQKNLINAYESSFVEKNKALVGVGDTLSRLRENYGVIDPDNQTEAITKVEIEAKSNYYRSKTKYDMLKGNPNISVDTLAMLEATMKGYEEEMKRSSEMLRKFSQGYNGVSMMKELYEQERNQIGRDKQRYLQLRIAFNTQISALEIVQTAKTPVNKSRPKRSIIVLSAALMVFVLTSVFALLAENYRDVNWKEITAPSNGSANGEESKPKIGFFKKAN
jgi:tyrosine-protein kinase Etk/Wzc